MGLVCPTHLATEKDPNDEQKLKKKTVSTLQGQSSWLQIRRPGFDSRHYQKKKRGPPSLVITTEELLDKKVAAPV
jgi:hypothetical protein